MREKRSFLGSLTGCLNRLTRPRFAPLTVPPFEEGKFKAQREQGGCRASSKPRAIWAFALTILATLALAQKTQDNPNRLHQLRELAVAELTVGKKKIKAWVMDDNSKRQEGMMFLTEKDTPLSMGMIFVFKDSAPRSFWNQNVPIDLDIAYIDAKGKVIRVTILKKKDTTGVPSNGDAKYVLEMRKGGFKPLEIKTGTKIGGLEKLKAKD